MGAIAAVLPRWLKRPLLLLRDRGDKMHCPCCGWSFRTFWPSGVNPVPNSMCPKCNSLQRHRLIWLFLNEQLGLQTQAVNLLHVAPEPLVHKLLKKRANVVYLSADLDSPLAMERMDLTDIHKPDNTFDAIICIHVLEHVPDDRKAMSELLRIMKPGGWALLQCPVDWQRATTYEDWSITAPADRLRAFGQEDHVRVYGCDYVQRLKAVGFDVERRPFARELGPAAAKRFGLDVNDDIVLCRKPTTLV